jgi:hypothetical protein
MTQTTALIVSSALALGLLGMLVLVLRLGQRLSGSTNRETLHPSQPLTLVILQADEDEGPELARVA